MFYGWGLYNCIFNEFWCILNISLYIFWVLYFFIIFWDFLVFKNLFNLYLMIFFNIIYVFLCIVFIEWLVYSVLLSCYLIFVILIFFFFSRVRCVGGVEIFGVLFNVVEFLFICFYSKESYILWGCCGNYAG